MTFPTAQQQWPQQSQWWEQPPPQQSQAQGSQPPQQSQPQGAQPPQQSHWQSPQQSQQSPPSTQQSQQSPPSTQQSQQSPPSTQQSQQSPPSPQQSQPWPQPPQQSPQPQQRTWDLVLAIVLYSGAALLGLVAAYATCFFAFAADSCGANNCNDSYLGAAFIVSWGGTALALVGALIMIIVAAMKRWYMWYWPVLAAIMIVGSFAAGVALASQVYPSS
ncbi:hypothetical protein ACIA8C_11025 [Nocardia sp. NPDC051321]|uniref:hypothetical protein n=1 Tax=Nocardia sp. NPDC051321 TaxID=3364323 RepID=UPI00378F6ECF